MELRKLDLKNLFFIGILILLGFVLIQLFSPFLNIIVIALVIVQLFYPFYRRIHKQVKNKGLASFISTLLTLFFVIIPIVVVILLAVSEINALTSNTNFSSIFTSLHLALIDVINAINGIMSNLGIEYSLEVPKLEALTIDLLEALRDRLLPITTSIISISLSTVFQLFLLLITLIYMFIEYENLPRLISRISPLDDELDKLLFKKFTLTTRAVIRGSFLVAITQATAVSLMLMLFNVGAPVLLWVIMVFFSLIPIGSGVVWFPVGIGMILTGISTANPYLVVQGVILIIYSAVIINVIDTTLRPQVMKNAIHLHPLIIIFSALGGIAMFGPLGILYGPLIAVFFAALMDVYVQRFTDKKHLLQA